MDFGRLQLKFSTDQNTSSRYIFQKLLFVVGKWNFSRSYRCLFLFRPLFLPFGHLFSEKRFWISCFIRLFRKLHQTSTRRSLMTTFQRRSSCFSEPRSPSMRRTQLVITRMLAVLVEHLDLFPKLTTTTVPTNAKMPNLMI